MSSKAQPRFSNAAILGAVALSPLVVRCLLLIEGEVEGRSADLLGVVADIGLSLILGSGLIAAKRIGSFIRPIGAVVVGCWCVLNFANYEHIRELGSMASLSHAGYLVDPTFLRGSVFAPTHPILLALTCCLSVALAWFALGADRHLQPLVPLLIGAALIAGVVVMPRTDAVAGWRQTNYLLAQSSRLVSRQREGVSGPSLGHGGLAVRDLDGTSILDGEGRARNVLLVVLEGVSGAFLPSFRAHHGGAPLFDMPELDRLAQRGFAYPSFVATQRQTNRGEYALLCGQYPKLLTAEAFMTELVGEGPLPCLPSVLRDAGFSTVYLQAAPMAFMMKDQFMPQAGFEQAHGDTWFKHSYNRNHWGVDDRGFFEQSLEMIDELDRADEPWFLTLLTVGTHHRYNVPPSFEGTHEAGSAAWAFEYLDHAVGLFVAELEAAGILDDTLVLITSDESQATYFGAPDAQTVVSQGWGFLIALAPDQRAGIVGEIFAQPDIPVSVADYLDLDKGRRAFPGRSVFRRYQHDREVFWGNTHMGMVAGVTLDHQLITCTEDFAPCSARAISDGLLFSPKHDMRAANEDEVDWLQSAAARSLDSHLEELRKRRITLISPRIHPVVPTPYEQYLFGGQFVSVEAHTTTDVKIEVEATGSSGWVDLVHLFVVNMHPSYSRTARINVGETLRLHYSVDTEFRLDNVECRMWITGSEGEDVGLEFTTAELSLAPATSHRPVAEVVEHRFDISGNDRQ